MVARDRGELRESIPSRSAVIDHPDWGKDSAAACAHGSCARAPAHHVDHLAFTVPLVKRLAFTVPLVKRLAFTVPLVKRLAFTVPLVKRLAFTVPLVKRLAFTVPLAVRRASARRARPVFAPHQLRPARTPRSYAGWSA